MTGVAKKPKKAQEPKPVKIPTPEQVLAVRTGLKLTQAEAADRIGVGQGVWAAWENGLRQPSRQSALLIDLLRHGKI